MARGYRDFLVTIGPNGDCTFRVVSCLVNVRLFGLLMVLAAVALGCRESEAVSAGTRSTSQQIPLEADRVVAVSALAATTNSAAGRTRIDYDDGTLLVEAGEPGSLRLVDNPGAVTVGRRVRCGWHAIGGSGFDPTWDSTVPVRPEAGGVYLLRCFHPDDNSNLTGYPRFVRYVDGGTIDGPVVSVADVERFAVDSIVFEIPSPVFSPPGRQVVGVDTWLGVASRLVYPVASAQAGDTWATVRPVLRHSEWAFADGSVVRCEVDIDKFWDPTADPGAQSTRCSRVFEHVSGPAGYATDVTVSWTIYERTNTHPDTWTVWGQVSRSMSTSIIVEELQAVIR